MYVMHHMCMRRLFRVLAVVTCEGKRQEWCLTLFNNNKQYSKESNLAFHLWYIHNLYGL